VEPSKHFADIIVPQGGNNPAVIDLLGSCLAQAARKEQAAKKERNGRVDASGNPNGAVAATGTGVGTAAASRGTMDAEDTSSFLQREMAAREVGRVSAIEAARWLDDAGASLGVPQLTTSGGASWRSPCRPADEDKGVGQQDRAPASLKARSPRP
jgi:hypothetical protein